MNQYKEQTMNRKFDAIKRTLTVLISVYLTVTPLFLEAQNIVDKSLPWSERMARSEMFRLGTVSFQDGGDFNFTHISQYGKWNYEMGLFLKSLDDIWGVTGDSLYFNYMQSLIDEFVQDDGTIQRYDLDDYNLDKINTGKVLLSLYQETGQEKYKIAANTLYKQLQGQPRTDAGGFWHKKRYPYQMWLDGVYMWSPFGARYARMFDKPDLFDDVVKQIVLIEQKTRDPATGLLYHAWDESRKQKWADNETGQASNFWGRGVGWYAMALVDVLDYLPQDHPGRAKIIAIYQRLSKALRGVQDAGSGVWYQVLDQPGREGNYLESSGSSMFVYSMLKGIRKGYLDESYLPAVKKAYQGLFQQFVFVDGAGMVSLTRTCSGAGLGGDPYRDGSYYYYVSEDLRTNDLKAISPFIMACLEMEKTR